MKKLEEQKDSEEVKIDQYYPWIIKPALANEKMKQLEIRFVLYEKVDIFELVREVIANKKEGLKPIWGMIKNI